MQALRTGTLEDALRLGAEALQHADTHTRATLALLARVETECDGAAGGIRVLELLRCHVVPDRLVTERVAIMLGDGNQVRALLPYVPALCAEGPADVKRVLAALEQAVRTDRELLQPVLDVLAALPLCTTELRDDALALVIRYVDLLERNSAAVTSAVRALLQVAHSGGLVRVVAALRVHLWPLVDQPQPCDAVRDAVAMALKLQRALATAYMDSLSAPGSPRCQPLDLLVLLSLAQLHTARHDAVHCVVQCCIADRFDRESLVAAVCQAAHGDDAACLAVADALMCNEDARARRWSGVLCGSLFVRLSAVRGRVVALLLGAYGAGRGPEACDAFEHIVAHDAALLAAHQHVAHELMSRFVGGYSTSLEGAGVAVEARTLQRTCHVVARMCQASDSVAQQVLMHVQKLCGAHVPRAHMLALCVCKHLAELRCLPPAVQSAVLDAVALLPPGASIEAVQLYLLDFIASVEPQQQHLFNALCKIALAFDDPALGFVLKCDTLERAFGLFCGVASAHDELSALRPLWAYEMARALCRHGDANVWIGCWVEEDNDRDLPTLVACMTAQLNHARTDTATPLAHYDDLAQRVRDVCALWYRATTSLPPELLLGIPPLGMSVLVDCLVGHLHWDHADGTLQWRSADQLVPVLHSLVLVLTRRLVAHGPLSGRTASRAPRRKRNPSKNPRPAKLLRGHHRGHDGRQGGDGDGDSDDDSGEDQDGANHLYCVSLPEASLAELVSERPLGAWLVRLLADSAGHEHSGSALALTLHCLYLLLCLVRTELPASVPALLARMSVGTPDPALAVAATVERLLLGLDSPYLVPYAVEALHALQWAAPSPALAQRIVAVQRHWLVHPFCSGTLRALPLSVPHHVLSTQLLYARDEPDAPPLLQSASPLPPAAQVHRYLWLSLTVVTPLGDDVALMDLCRDQLGVLERYCRKDNVERRAEGLCDASSVGSIYASVLASCNTLLSRLGSLVTVEVGPPRLSKAAPHCSCRARTKCNWPSRLSPCATWPASGCATRWS